MKEPKTAARKKSPPAQPRRPAAGSLTGRMLSRENIEALVIAVVLALFIRNFVVQAFKIPSGSMEPTLLIGDHILVNKFIYGISNQIQIPLLPDITYRQEKLFAFRKPARGDVIVFIFPLDESKDFIKRVIAVEGDTVEIRRKQVYINGSPAPDPHAHFTNNPVYRSMDAGSNPRDNFGPVTVPPGNLFVMGDNRDNSQDSRFWGFVNVNKVRGKAFMIYWSWEGFLKNFRWRRLCKFIE